MGGLFEFGVNADEKNSETDIAQLSQGGLGMPDRDYYLLDDNRSKTLREQYEQHVAKMFALLGDPADQAAAEAKTVPSRPNSPRPARPAWTCATRWAITIK